MNIKNLFRIFIDTTILGSALVLATLVRLEGQVVSNTDKFIWEVQLFKILPIVVLVQLVILLAFKTYKRFWRYTSVNEIIHLARSLAIAAVIILIPRMMGLKPGAGDLYAVSFGVTVIDFLLALGLLSTVRLLRAYIVEQKNIKRRLLNINPSLKRTLIVGAGEAGLAVIKSITQHPEQGLIVVGALDDDTKKHKMNLAAGVTVYGAIDDVKYWVDELAIDQVIIAIPSLSLQDSRRVNVLCSEAGVDVRIMPGVDQLAGGQVTVEQIRKLSMEDLLGREEIDLSGEEVHSFLEGKRVLVTGAGGSIGKELCKQLARSCNIASLCLVGKGENSIFETVLDLDEIFAEGEVIDIEKRIADIRNLERMDTIFREFKPQVVFHAAAHKHVHLMELNPCEAFENNVLGTENIARLSGEHGVEACVLISTDKAVNPTSIMGSTKSLAEKVTLMTSKDYPNTKYTAVRFGNVLGSRGSVVKVWESQLRNGQPITVTHKEAIRYFMTIPEASQLVIQAAARAGNGEIMVLDMGTPIKIYELAQQFIQLSGFSLEDVPIEIIGLREGEKLYEELLTDDESVDHKLTDKIYKAKINFNLGDRELKTELAQLKDLAAANDINKTKTKIKTLMKELINVSIAV